MATTGDLHLGPIGQIAVNARDLERAIGFYRDILGMTLLFQVPNMAFFDCGGVRLMIGLPSEPAFDHAASVIYYRVDDIRAAHRTLAGRGVEFSTPPHLVARLPDHELWLAFFNDTEGNVLALMAELRPAA